MEWILKLTDAASKKSCCMRLKKVDVLLNIGDFFRDVLGNSAAMMAADGIILKEEVKAMAHIRNRIFDEDDDRPSLQDDVYELIVDSHGECIFDYSDASMSKWFEESVQDGKSCMLAEVVIRRPDECQD